MKPEKSKLFLFLLVLLYLPAAWFVILLPVAKVKTFFTNLPGLVNTNLVSRFPPTLEIKVTNGVVSLNQKTPFCFQLSDKTGIVIDPSATANPLALSATGPYSKLCQPLALVGANFFLYPDQNSGYKIQQLPTDTNLTINHTYFAAFVDKYLPVLSSVGQKAYYILPFVGVIFTFLFLLLLNLWYASMVQLAFKIFKKPVPSYSRAYDLSLFFYDFILVFDWFFLGALNYFLKTDISLSFFLRNTLIICAASILISRSPTQSGSDPTPTSLSK